jgi:hypothetical protein
MVAQTYNLWPRVGGCCRRCELGQYPYSLCLALIRVVPVRPDEQLQHRVINWDHKKGLEYRKLERRPLLFVVK